MKISENEYSEIQIVSSENELIVSISDTNIIVLDGYKVICVPDNNQSRLLFLVLSGLETGVSTPLMFRT